MSCNGKTISNKIHYKLVLVTILMLIIFTMSSLYVTKMSLNVVAMLFSNI